MGKDQRDRAAQSICLIRKKIKILSPLFLRRTFYSKNRYGALSEVPHKVLEI